MISGRLREAKEAKAVNNQRLCPKVPMAGNETAMSPHRQDSRPEKNHEFGSCDHLKVTWSEVSLLVQTCLRRLRESSVNVKLGFERWRVPILSYSSDSSLD